MIDVAEHARRPTDMLMLIGEYLKEYIRLAIKAKSTKQEMNSFYILPQILNSLGTACKQLVEAPVQQLRLLIALIRNPAFENKT